MALTATTAEFFTAQQAAIEKLAARPAVIQKRARWQLRGERYLKRWGGMAPGALIQVDPGLQQQALAWIEQVAPATAKAYERHLVPVAQAAFERMPVDTGLTKSLMALEFGVGETTFTGSLANRSPYVAFIWGGRAATSLIWQPGERAADRMAHDLAAELAR